MSHSPSPTSQPSLDSADPKRQSSIQLAPPSPLLLATGSDTEIREARRPTISFLGHKKGTYPSPKRGRERRRISSPPPPPVFQPRVSFDTFDKPADFIEENAFTLVAKHKDYEYTKRSRTFLCGCDDNDYSYYALQWLIDELVDDGDEIVCLRVVEKDDDLAGDRSVENGQYRAEADALMRRVQEQNHENKAINLILEFAIGKVNKVIDEMISLYEPAILVVGTRGRSLGGFQGLLPGSISKYCLQHSPVPVIVVRPSTKRDKARKKRANDPVHNAYRQLIEKGGGPVLGGDVRDYAVEDSQEASDEEAMAVAAAIGYKPVRERSPLVHVQSSGVGDIPAVQDTLRDSTSTLKGHVSANGNGLTPTASPTGEHEPGVDTEPVNQERSGSTDSKAIDSAVEYDGGNNSVKPVSFAAAPSNAATTGDIQGSQASSFQPTNGATPSEHA